MLGPEAVTPSPQSLGGEDFAWYLESVPGALARLGTRASGSATDFDIHQAVFDIDEKALKEVEVDGSRRSPGFASKDRTKNSHPTQPAAFPEFLPVVESSVLAYSCAAARDLTRFPVFTERQRRAFRVS